MRPLRFLLTLATTLTFFSLLLYLRPWHASHSSTSNASINTYLNWHTPSSLFPPSAIISLTDDNSTFFLARPAAFGPLIPAKSLSAQLWIGSAFGEDHLGRSGAGELGCSDVPGWSDGIYVGKSLKEVKEAWGEGQKGGGGRLKKRGAVYDEEENEEGDGALRNDGTDDHLHHPLPPSDGLKTSGAKKATHADIQSLQESAEIAGKVVLLSRGGCGFLEKAKWVQRRGGVALIVGDDTRGGPLVTMYARGDTSNVTIPALFTSHTTAHLLSSLIPSGAAAQEAALAGGKGRDGKKSDTAVDQPNFTTSSEAPKATKDAAKAETHNTHDTTEHADSQDSHHKGWLSSLFGKEGPAQQEPEAPIKLGWVLQEEFDDEEVLKYGKKQVTTTTTLASAPSAVPDHGSSDGFVIGVQDWRDPDLVAHQREQTQPSKSLANAATAESGAAKEGKESKVDSITPGSGEYAKLQQEPKDTPDSKDSSHDPSTHGKQKSSDGSWLGRLFTDDTNGPAHAPETNPSKSTHLSSPSHPEPADLHEGLWVTLTPTSISTSPLFDTLLVLVVSPLVTLTVVYALLLLRSRIRRRRWRAPKSVVERLPVRTYQTLPTTATSSSSSSNTAVSSPTISATTPLLPSLARPISSRPRSRTTPAPPVPATASAPEAGSSLEGGAASSAGLEEKRGLAEWRRRYGGRQRECVVCLEEYVDGVSRVMRLPCGHEFHEGCITPWLTTRRRTCPICKGDVVREMHANQQLSSSSSSVPVSSPPPLEILPELVAEAPVESSPEVVEDGPIREENERLSRREEEEEEQLLDRDGREDEERDLERGR